MTKRGEDKINKMEIKNKELQEIWFRISGLMGLYLLVAFAMFIVILQVIITDPSKEFILDIALGTLWGGLLWIGIQGYRYRKKEKQDREEAWKKSLVDQVAELKDHSKWDVETGKEHYENTKEKENT
jgi:cytochrome bd-type quinol oxidase subunit 1|tara:strand:+ start:244 stop:624 length:381 start_codon:yes stop_codon:yes gene_type:complete